MNQQKKIKLIKKASRNYIFFGIVIMIVSLIILYFITKYFILEETEESLFTTTYRIEKLLEENPNLNSIDPIINIEKVEIAKNQIIRDTLIFDPSQDEIELFRELTSYKEINGVKYKIAVRTLEVESEEVLIAVLISYLTIIFLVFLAQYYFSKINAKIIWQPFFENLERIKGFSIQANKPINLQETDIIEFSELNEEITGLTNKVISDYQNLKQFTEDVSHEIQTPLSIIQAKIGNLIDENKINDKQFKLITEIQQNTHRLANLNKKLVLLTKIENNQFKTSTKVNITKFLQKSIQNFEDLSEANISIKKMDSIEVYLDDVLAQTLTDNLISNAIKYVDNDGEIVVSTSKNKLSISNTGVNAISNPEKLYNRFYRENTSKKSLGLGLAIVKKICDQNGFQISYMFEKKAHIFKINFFPKK